MTVFLRVNYFSQGKGLLTAARNYYTLRGKSIKYPTLD